MNQASDDGKWKSNVAQRLGNARAKMGDWTGSLEVVPLLEDIFKMGFLDGLMLAAIDRPDIREQILAAGENLQLPNARTWLLHGLLAAQTQSERWTDALKTLQAMDPISVPWDASIVEIARRAGHPEAARSLVDRARAAALESAKINSLEPIAAEYIRLGDLAEAMRLAGMIDPNRRSSMFDTLAQTLAEEGHHTDAIELTARMENFVRQIFALASIAATQAGAGHVAESERTFDIARQLVRAHDHEGVRLALTYHLLQYQGFGGGALGRWPRTKWLVARLAKRSQRCAPRGFRLSAGARLSASRAES